MPERPRAGGTRIRAPIRPSGYEASVQTGGSSLRLNVSHSEPPPLPAEYSRFAVSGFIPLERRDTTTRKTRRTHSSRTDGRSERARIQKLR